MQMSEVNLAEHRQDAHPLCIIPWQRVGNNNTVSIGDR